MVSFSADEIGKADWVTENRNQRTKEFLPPFLSKAKHPTDRLHREKPSHTELVDCFVAEYSGMEQPIIPLEGQTNRKSKTATLSNIQERHGNDAKFYPQ